LVAVGDWRRALRLAASLGGHGDDTAAIERAWQAVQRPGFCREIGQDPAALIDAGKAALTRRYGT